LPQYPQLLALVVTLMQDAEQHVGVPVPQTSKHVPQLALSLWMSAQYGPPASG
jgi:hypothetical protein